MARVASPACYQDGAIVHGWIAAPFVAHQALPKLGEI
jgi:hypothetical protein